MTPVFQNTNGLPGCISRCLHQRTVKHMAMLWTLSNRGEVSFVVLELWLSLVKVRLELELRLELRLGCPYQGQVRVLCRYHNRCYEWVRVAHTAYTA